MTIYNALRRKSVGKKKIVSSPKTHIIVKSIHSSRLSETYWVVDIAADGKIIIIPLIVLIIILRKINYEEEYWLFIGNVYVI